MVRSKPTASHAEEAGTRNHSIHRWPVTGGFKMACLGAVIDQSKQTPGSRIWEGM